MYVVFQDIEELGLVSCLNGVCGCDVEMVRSLVCLCAQQVVSDHGLSAAWLGCVPRELYGPLLDAAFAHCRPLAIGELVQRWPERTLSVGGRGTPDRDPPNRLCVQALLLAVVRGLTDKRYDPEFSVGESFVRVMR